MTTYTVEAVAVEEWPSRATVYRDGEPWCGGEVVGRDVLWEGQIRVAFCGVSWFFERRGDVYEHTRTPDINAGGKPLSLAEQPPLWGGE